MEVLEVVAWWSQPFQPGPSVVSFLGPGEGVVDGVDGFAGGLLGEVAVDVGGGREGGVPQRLGDDGEGDAGGDGDRGGQVPQVVNGHSRYTGLFGELPEPVEDGVGSQGPAVGSAEDEPGERIAGVAVAAAAS
ncbi:hypothetical protein OHB39_26505 [Streptomyces sp. NBC_00047]|nr:hypothetical protein [Streptomyces sp. NBC_00047]MCX5611081.1 hypothetical protein [Streptomyces sp. NBC_00047]